MRGGNEARVLLIPETKTGTPRQVLLFTAALGVLDGLPRRIDGRVWGIRPDSISQAFELVGCFTSLGKVKAITGLIFHDLRHEATSRLLKEGLNPWRLRRSPAQDLADAEAVYASAGRRPGGETRVDDSVRADSSAGSGHSGVNGLTERVRGRFDLVRP